MFRCTLLALFVAVSAAQAAGPPALLRTSWDAHEGAVTAVAVSPDGATFATAGADGEVVVWGLTTGQARVRLPRPKGKPYAVAFSTDGARLATAGAGAVIEEWSATTGKRLRQLKGHVGPVASLAYSPDGKCLASGGYDRTVRLWPAGGEKATVLKGADGRVTALAFTPDSKSLVSGGAAVLEVVLKAKGVKAFSTNSNSPANDGPGILQEEIGEKEVNRMAVADRVRVWDVAAGKLSRTLAVPGSAVALLPNGRAVAAGLVAANKKGANSFGLDGTDTITVFDLKTGKVRAALTFRGLTVAASPDGRSLATAAGTFEHFAGNVIAANNGKGWVYGLKKGDRVTSALVPAGDDEEPNNIIMGNGGGAYDHQLTFRDPRTLKPRQPLKDKQVTVMAFMPNGRALIVGRKDGTIRLHAAR